MNHLLFKDYIFIYILALNLFRPLMFVIHYEKQRFMIVYAVYNNVIKTKNPLKFLLLLTLYAFIFFFMFQYIKVNRYVFVIDEAKI